MFSSKKPFTAVTAQIDRLCLESQPENDYSGIPDLIEVITIQPTGATEAARAVRKKLKYGQPPVQRRAITVLDALVENAGTTFDNTIAHDIPLLDRLTHCALDPATDPSIQRKLQSLFARWHSAYASTPNLALIAGLQKATRSSQHVGPANARAIEQMAHTSKSKDWNGPGRAWDRHYDPIREAKKRRKMQKEKERDQALREFDANSQHARGLSSSSHQSAFDLKKELPALQQTLAQSHLEATSLLNALQHYHSQPRHGSDLAEASASSKSHSPGFRKPSVSHGGHTSITPGSISADPALASKFNSCKALRRQVLRYIENISDEQWLGGLISANEALVGALKSFEILDGAADGDGSDSDSDVEQAEGVQHQRPRGENEEDVEEEDDEEEEVAREDEDEDDPFADRNAIK